MSRNKIPQIQALRAIAAGLVLIYHANVVPGGYVGVDIFYVISGFLITNLLIRELSESSSLNFKRFYARRAKRLLPSSLLVIAMTGILGWLLLPATMRQAFGKDLIAASTYISNFLFALWENDYQNLNSTPSPFIHFWSLAVEEQFYMFWPLFLFVLYKVGKKKAVFFGTCVLVLTSFLFSMYMTITHPIWAFYILPTRAWELGVGALIAFLPSKIAINKLLLWFSIAALAITALIFNESTAFPGMAALIPVISTAILISGHSNWPLILTTVAKNSLVQWLGKISYPLYLWHWPVLVIPAICLGRTLTIIEKLAAFVLIIILSALTHYMVEEPIRLRKWQPKRTFTYAAIATVLSTFLGLAIFSTYNNSISISGLGKISLEEIRIKPINDLDGCHVHRGVTKSPRCEYGDPYGKQVIVLYGDSHAAQWLPALDAIGKRNHIKVIALTKSACSATELILPISAQYSIDDCQSFRDNSIKRISKLKPDAVITSSYQQLATPDGRTDVVAWWQEGESKLLSRLKGLTKNAIYITDTPRPQVDIPNCLATKDLRNCDTSIKMDATTPAGFIKIDPTPWLCFQTCPAIVNEIIAYRDQSHISVAMSEHLAPRLESALKARGIF